MSNINKIRYNGIDYGVGDEANNNNYSTEEQIIGTWLDGKPLYRKTIVIDITTDDTKYYEHNISDVDIIYIDIGNTFIICSDERICSFIMLGIGEGNVVDGYTTMIQSLDKTSIKVRSCTNGVTGKGYVTLKYTKTTD